MTITIKKSKLGLFQYDLNKWSKPNVNILCPVCKVIHLEGAYVHIINKLKINGLYEGDLKCCFCYILDNLEEESPNYVREIEKIFYTLVFNCNFFMCMKFFRTRDLFEDFNYLIERDITFGEILKVLEI